MNESNKSFGDLQQSLVFLQNEIQMASDQYAKQVQETESKLIEAEKSRAAAEQALAQASYELANVHSGFEESVARLSFLEEKSKELQVGLIAKESEVELTRKDYESKILELITHSLELEEQTKTLAGKNGQLAERLKKVIRLFKRVEADRRNMSANKHEALEALNERDQEVAHLQNTIAHLHAESIVQTRDMEANARRADEVLEASRAEFQTEREEFASKLNYVKAKYHEAVKLAAEKAKEASHLNQKLAQATHEASESQAQIQAIFKSHEQVQKDFVAAKNELSVAKDQNAHITKVVQSLTADRRELEAANAAFKTEIETLKATVAQASSVIRHRDEKLARSEAEASELRSRVANFEGQSSSVRNEVQRLEHQNAQLSRKIETVEFAKSEAEKSARAEAKALELQIKELERKVTATQSEVHSIDLHLAATQAKIGEKENEIRAAQNSRDMIYAQLDAAEQREQDGRNEKLELQHQIMTLNHEIAYLKETLHAHDERLTEENKAVESKIQALESERKAIDEKSNAVATREKQLKNYAMSLANEKEALRTKFEAFVREVNALRHMNPLNDYLEVTEREISRIEKQLAKTPTISSDRPRLEKCFNDLIEQRDFLRQAVQKSSSELDRRLSTVAASGMTSLAGSMTVTPPLPPRYKSETELD